MADEALTRMSNAPTRVGRPFPYFTKGLGIARSATALLCAFLAFGGANAQNAPCGLDSLTIPYSPAYQPIAVAAHVGGDVILMVSFAHDGAVQISSILTGPAMLKSSAVAFASHWQANPSEGSRECPFVVSFRINEDGPPKDCEHQSADETIRQIDTQHIAIERASLWTCDPSVTIPSIRHHFLFFHWNTKDRDD